ncbi:hypothetical protein D3C74_372460 [compost metagenome]
MISKCKEFIYVYGYTCNSVSFAFVIQSDVLRILLFNQISFSLFSLLMPFGLSAAGFHAIFAFFRVSNFVYANSSVSCIPISFSNFAAGYSQCNIVLPACLCVSFALCKIHTVLILAFFSWSIAASVRAVLSSRRVVCLVSCVSFIARSASSKKTQ